MQMRTVAQLNHEGFFLYAVEAYGDGMPGNTIAEFPPEGALPEHHRWQWDGTQYIVVADYRGKTVYRVDGSTYHPTTFGPLPDGDSLDPPPPSPEEQAKQREAAFNAAINQRLQAFIQERGWDSLDRALGQTGAFAADAAIVQTAYDAIWQAAIPLFSTVTAGEMAVEDAMARLPVPAWPEE